MSALQRLATLLGLISVSLGQDSIEVDSLHVTSEIRHRYAVTLVTSQVTNMADFAQDVRFDVQLPKEAFISNFSMLIDGVVYPGEVAEKEVAAKKFEAAVQSGQSAGLVVTKSVRETNDFTVSVNVAASKSVTFNLTYQELLQRRTGLYEHVIYINPGVIVPDFRIEVFINESREITELTVPEIRGDRLTAVITGSNKLARIDSISASAARVTFTPTPEQQQEYSDRGISGQFIVNYDVDHDVSPEGEILVSNGYFVHFFAPDNLPVLGKRIMFVLDVSGSMSGTKIRQLREALVFILDELRPSDEFGILTFNSGVNFWPDPFEMIPASSRNIDRAKLYAETIVANGGTNIHDALVEGLRALSAHPTKPSMVLFLTDGRATSGETNSARILESVAETRIRRQFIYSLAFGRGADFDLIRKISAQNKGFARRIYEDADATLQLAGFYRVISSPVLSEVFISYLNDSVDLDNVTTTEYPGFFRGSEIVICGPLIPGSDVTGSFEVLVEGIQNSSNLFVRRFVPTQPAPGPIRGRNDFIERLWVYLTIKQLIEKTVEENNATSPTAVSAKARVIELALKYNFVTPYTSMVVTRPEEKNTVASTETEESTNSDSVGPQARQNFFTTTTPSAPPGTFRPRPGTIIPTPGRTPLRTFPTTTSPPPSSTPLRTFPTHTPPPSSTPLRTFPTHTPPPKATSLRTFPTHTTPRPGTFTTTTTTTTPRTTTTAVTTTSDPRQVLDFASGLNVQLNTTSGFSLCLDVPARSTPGVSEILLLNDMRNGIVVTGYFHENDYDNYRKFSEVRVALSVPNQNVNIRITTKLIAIGQNTYRWWQIRAINFQDIDITDKDGIKVSTSGNLVLIFHKFGLETTRSLTAPYITVTAENLQSVSEDASGALASVSKLEDVQRTSPSTLTYFLPYGGDEMQISSANSTEAELRMRETGILEDKTLEENQCMRLYERGDLEEILSFRTG